MRSIPTDLQVDPLPVYRVSGSGTDQGLGVVLSAWLWLVVTLHSLSTRSQSNLGKHSIQVLQYLPFICVDAVKLHLERIHTNKHIGSPLFLEIYTNNTMHYLLVWSMFAIDGWDSIHMIIKCIVVSIWQLVTVSQQSLTCHWILPAEPPHSSPQC